VEIVQTQRDIDAMDKLRDVVAYGTVMAQHPRDTNERYWVNTEHLGFWLYPGEFAVELSGQLYIVGLRDA
jgi:hypothetical protein